MPGPRDDAVVQQWLAERDIPGLVDIHTHFLPEPVLRKVWAYFDKSTEYYGMEWPIHYRHAESTRLRILDELGVVTFAPLVYPHKQGMARWLTGWAMDFGKRVPRAVPTATMYPEPDAVNGLVDALEAGAKCVKTHVQVGRFDPRDERLDPAWGALADSGVPVIVHCGDGPIPGEYTGLKIFEEVLRRHPRLVAVLAHAGMPDYATAFTLAERYRNVHLDTTMVGVAFTERFAPLPRDWASKLADLPDRIVLGTDFPNIPYPYSEQLRAIAGWADSDPRLGPGFLRRVLHDTPARLLR